MTIEEATKYLQKVYVNTKNSSYASALAFALSALRAQQEAEKNEPLTLEELHELKYSEPIWIEFLSPDRPSYLKSQWHLFCSVNYIAKTWYPDGALCLCTGGALDLSKFGKTWLAYRRPPNSKTRGSHGTN